VTKPRVLLTGATGTIGRATLGFLEQRGYDVVRYGRDTNLDGLNFDVVISCMASRSGAPADAWAVDHKLNLEILTAAKRCGAKHFVLLSAICVQRPKLAFQYAKLAFEKALIESGMTYSIVRPTAYFKSLSGQVRGVKAGKPFLVFGNGTLTACKPLSDRDLAHYLVDCLENPELKNRILPIGGPGPAITPLDQVAILSRLLKRDVKVRRVPVAVMHTIIAVLRMGGLASAKLAAKAELAKIGHYYATESMLVYDKGYNADATPEYGGDTLEHHYAALLRGEVAHELGEHAVFE
jgi:divinyl chlorophyllide a 8-vinyl-reductase